MRIGFVQLMPVLGDVKSTIKKIDRLSPQFKYSDIIVFPELCNAGYNLDSYEQA